MRVLHCTVIFLLLVAGAHAQVPLEGTPIQRRSDLPHASGFVARGENIGLLLSALGNAAGRAMVVSSRAQKRRISGNFDLEQPMKALAKVTSELGLVWYGDGQSIYVYEADEQRNAVGRLRSASLATLNDFLRRAQLHDARYALRDGGAAGTFYIAGPPVYVDIVLNAARYLDEIYEGADTSTAHIEVISLEHSFVNGRRYGMRSQESQLPGVAESLAGVLQLGDFGIVVKQPSTYAGALTSGPQVNAPVTAAAGTTPLPVEMTSEHASASKRNDGMLAVVMAYPETNSLIVRGSLTQIEQVRRLVGELDVPRRQIELSLWIIDIKRTELDRLGVNWSGGLQVGSHLSVGFNQEGQTSTLDGARFLAAVDALASRGDARIVSRPILLTQENIPAYFDSNQTFYAQLIGERTTSLEKVTYGTLVSVRPRINMAYEIEMQLRIEDGAAEASGTGTALPMVNRTEIDTVARVPQRLSLLIGGYTRRATESGSNGIKGLKRIRWIGRLFGQDSLSHEQTARVFLIQPRVVATADALEDGRLPSLFGEDVGVPLQGVLRDLSTHTRGMTRSEEAAHGNPDR